MEFFEMARETGRWECEKVATERFPVRVCPSAVILDIFSLCRFLSLSLSLIFFSFDRRGVAHVFGRPGRGGGAVDCTWMEAHASEAFEEGYVEDLLGTHVVIFVVTFRCAPFFKPVAPKPVLMLLPGGL